jgi:hypothetical protein
MTCHTQIIFHKRLIDGWQNVSAATYNLSTHLQTQFLMLTLTCTQMFMWVLKLLNSDITNPCNRFLCMWEVFLGSSVPQNLMSSNNDWKTPLREAMLHVHRNDTVGQENPEAVLKRFDRVAIGKSILHSPTKYCHLRLFIKILFQRPISCVVLFTIEASTTWSLFTIVTGI